MYIDNVYITDGEFMVRTQIYLTEEEKNGLELTSRIQGVSQSYLIREAIDSFLAKPVNADRSSIIDEIAGIWSEKKDIPDIRDLRSGWNRREK